MLASHPAYPVMQAHLRNLHILKNPQCWFNSKALLEDIPDPERAATEAKILDEIEAILHDQPPVWWPWK